jgi:hypothetical protein
MRGLKVKTFAKSGTHMASAKEQLAHCATGADRPVATELSSRVRRLVENPTYLQADEDLAFLRRPEMCGIRLQLDYWKTEEALQRHEIHHTIVV